MTRIALLLLLALSCTVAQAQMRPTITKNASGGYSTSTLGNKTTIIGPSPAPDLPAAPPGSTPSAKNIVTPQGPITTTLNVPSGMATGHVDNGLPGFKGTAKAPVPGMPGKDIVIDVEAKVVKNSMAKAIGKFAFKQLPLLGAASDVYELLGELGITKQTAPDGTPVLAKAQVSEGIFARKGTSPYTPDRVGPSVPDLTVGSVTASCAWQYPADWPIAAGPPLYTLSGQTAASQCGRFKSNGQFELSPGLGASVSRLWRYADGNWRPDPPPSGGGYLGESTPITEQALIDEIASKSGWPVSSAISRAVAEAVNKGDEPIELEKPTVTGPATAPGPSTTTTTQTASGTTTTTNTTNYNIVYQGDTITYNSTTVTNTTNPNGTTSTMTVTEQPKTEVCGLPGTPACKIDETGTPSTVDTSPGLAKLKEDADKRDALLDAIKNKNDKDTSFVWPSWLSSGSCSPWDFGTFPVINFRLTLDMCPFFAWVTPVVSFLWLLGTWYACLGLVRQTVAGGAA